MKITRYYTGIIILTFFVSCDFNKVDDNVLVKGKDSIDRLQEHVKMSKYDTLKLGLELVKESMRIKHKDVQFKPVFWERKYIVGNFFGSGIDTLRESYISQLTNKETSNDHEIVNYSFPDVVQYKDFDDEIFMMDTLISLICSAKPRVLLKSSNPGISILYLNTQDMCQSTGITYLINVGDVNNDKKDDVAVMCGYIRHMGVNNTCQIFSYISNKWEGLLSFTVHGPLFDMRKEEDVKKSKITSEIPGYLEKKKGKWYYFDYYWNVVEGVEMEMMRPLKIK